MSGNGSTLKRCGCTDPATDKQLGAKCPELEKRHHGTWSYKVRLDLTSGRRQIDRSGFAREKDARAKLDQIADLIKLAADDDKARRKIGDMIAQKTNRGGELPTIEDVRRRLGLGRELDTSETFGEAWAVWLAGRRKARPSYANQLEQLGRNWLLPVLADIALDRINGEHCNMVFERVEMFNEEIEAAREDGRKPDVPGDVRQRRQYTGIATQHRIFAALRVFLNYQWKRAHKIPFNPVYMVELEPETRDAPLVWDAEQVADFLDHTADDRLHFLWRLALLRGFRRGELAGMADKDIDLDDAAISVNVALLMVGGKLVWGRPKSKAGERVVDLDEGSVTAGRAHRARRKRERLAAGGKWQDSGRAFTREDGSPLNPDYITRRFKELAKEAGLPVIKLHAARHTAASLMFDADIDIKIVQEVLGHSTSAITRDIYTHVRRQKHRDAAEKTMALLPDRSARRKTGS